MRYKALRAVAAAAALMLAGTAVLPAFAVGEGSVSGGEPITPDDGDYLPANRTAATASPTAPPKSPPTPTRPQVSPLRCSC